MRRNPVIPYFAYGSNLDPLGMQFRCPYAKRGRKAQLDGWQLAFAGVADIDKMPGETVPGAIWYISLADVRKLDSYEGYPSLYIRHWVEVDGEKCLVYEMRHKNELMLPSPHYYETIAQGYAFWDLPLGALETAYYTAEDDCRGRGITSFMLDGKKRMKAVPTKVNSGMSPATIAELRLSQEDDDEEEVCDANGDRG